jgi:hypothetical protein
LRVGRKADDPSQKKKIDNWIRSGIIFSGGLWLKKIAVLPLMMIAPATAGEIF